LPETFARETYESDALKKSSTGVNDQGDPDDPYFPLIHLL